MGKTVTISYENGTVTVPMFQESKSTASSGVP